MSPSRFSQIVRIPRDGHLPLSIVQEIVLGRCLQNENGVFSSIATQSHKYCIRVKGPLDEAALKRAINDIARRHDILRTTFRAIGGRPMQVIAPPELCWDLPVIRLEADSEEAHLAEALRITGTEIDRPFNMFGDSLWKTLLIQLEENDYVLLIILNHLISDALSMQLLLRDVWTSYFAHSTGRKPALNELPIQYVDFAAWQRQALRGQGLENVTSYWRRQLNGLGPFPRLHLRDEKELGPVSGFRPYARKSFDMSPTLTESLLDLCRQKSASPQMLLMAGLVALLHLHSGKNDIGIRFLSAKRDRPETKELIGWFADMLVLRARVAALDPFCDLLRRVRNSMLESYEHQDLPYSIFPGYEEHVSRGTFYPSFSLHIYAEAQGWNRGSEGHRTDVSPGLQIAPLAVADSDSIQAPGIAFIVKRAGRTLNLQTEYEIDRYDAGHIASLMNDLVVILERVVADPEQRVSALATSITGA